MEMFLKITPPTVTAQTRKVSCRCGKPVFYDTERLKQAKRVFDTELLKHKPKERLDGPLKLCVCWCFDKKKNHKEREWKTTRPDTDNLLKLLKDRMTVNGFWFDDCQVVYEVSKKVWVKKEDEGILIKVDKLERTMSDDE